jgi:general secretion pathway protein G
VNDRDCHAPQGVRGFTLIELLIVLAILGLLATLTVPVAEVTIQRSREQDLRSALREIRAGIDAYKRAYDEGRIVRPTEASGYPEALQVLVDGVEDARHPNKAKMFFLRRIPPDPMYPQHLDDPAETWGKRAYDSEANDPRAGKDVYDVHSMSPRIGLNGIPYRRW